LSYVGQFMSQQFLSRPGRRHKPACCENHVSTYRVSFGIYRCRGLSSLRIRMHSHIAEVATETRLHEVPGTAVKWLSRRTQSFTYDRRHLRSSGYETCRRLSLNRSPLPSARIASLAAAGVITAVTGSLHNAIDGR